MECTITGVTVSDKLATIEKGETAILRYSGGAVLPEVKVKVKVVTLLGTPAEKYAYPAGSARAEPVLDHFEFDNISSPQITGVSFIFTVRALDQYGSLFTGSIGHIQMAYRDGDRMVVVIGNLFEMVNETGHHFFPGVREFGMIMFRSPSTDVTITIELQSDPSINGTSNAFNVISWLVGWDCRKSHVIENASGAGTNYQVPIVVDYGSGVDGGDTVYLNGCCQPDFGDIRFTGDNEGTELDYWLESFTPSGSALFWVEVADNLNSSDATIYIYYGNDTVSTTSDGDATFIFFDDFLGSSLNTSKWTKAGYMDDGDSVTVSGGELRIEEYDSDLHWTWIETRDKFELDQNNFIWEAKQKAVSEDGHINANVPFMAFFQTGESIDYGAQHHWFGVRDCLEFAWKSVSWYGNSYETWTDLPDEYWVWSIVKQGADVTPYIHDLEYNQLYTSTTQTIVDVEVWFRLAVRSNCVSLTDWCRVRNYVDLPPAHGDWGEEELAPWLG
jgi:hypothetical protein